VASPEESVATAARRMAEHDVGTLVVVDEHRHPLGMLTDRDVTLRCVAAGRDPAHTGVAAVMSAPVVSVGEATPIETALKRMRGTHMRRLVVVDAAGRLEGLLALDDVLDLLVEEATSIGSLLRSTRPAPRATKKS
jgi:CBS domain-containing protein